MENTHKNLIIAAIIIIGLVGALALMVNNSHSSSDGPSYNATLLSEKLTVNMSNWSYDKANDIYYQMGLVYCMNPENDDYEACGIYVPGKYFEATKNSNGKYTCALKTDGKVGNYTAAEAPIVIPVITPGYSACKAPTVYNASKVNEYTDAGFIYLNPGCRGKDIGEAPDGVTDLKAAVTYYRFNGDVLPGNTEKIFTFGLSGGGAQSAIMGASGNSELYDPYMESIQAAMVDKNGNKLSNAIFGAMCWCPITSFDTANAAYEWNMGQYTRNDSSFTGQLSSDLAREYPTYINELGLTDPNGRLLTLEESETGIYASGSYYDYILSVTEESLNNFLNETKFPYTPPIEDETGNAQNGDAPSGGASSGGNSKDLASDSKTYKNAQEYIDSLNGNDSWIEYDASTNTAKIKSIEAFVKHCKKHTRSPPAFDNLNRSQIENELFGLNDHSLHFDKTVHSLLENNSDKYSKYSGYSKNYQTGYSKDLAKNDSENNSMETRVNMYNPMYYLSDYYDGAGSSDVAKYWRINTGIKQGDTSQCVDVNLYLAVSDRVGFDNVEFSTVWDEGHARAERIGSPTTNFINWVHNCLN
nr:subtype A tannase [uncultured Methanobrevibacter sp.]